MWLRKNTDSYRTDVTFSEALFELNWTWNLSSGRSNLKLEKSSTQRRFHAERMFKSYVLQLHFLGESLGLEFQFLHITQKKNNLLSSTPGSPRSRKKNINNSSSMHGKQKVLRPPIHGSIRFVEHLLLLLDAQFDSLNYLVSNVVYVSVLEQWEAIFFYCRARFLWFLL